MIINYESCYNFFLNLSLQKYSDGTSLVIMVQLHFLCLAEVPSKASARKAIYTEKVAH